MNYSTDATLNQVPDWLYTCSSCVVQRTVLSLQTDTLDNNAKESRPVAWLPVMRYNGSQLGSQGSAARSRSSWQFRRVFVLILPGC